MAGFLRGGDGEVQLQQLGEQVLLGGEAVGGENGGVEGGVGVLEGVLAGQFQRPVDGPEAAADLPQCLRPDPPPPGALAVRLDYLGDRIRVVGTRQRPEWIAADVAAVLGIKNVRSTLALFDDDEKGVHTMDTPGGRQPLATVTEPGLYRLIFKSRRPEARDFRRWVFHEVLPSIRRHGCYPPPAQGGPLGITEAIDARTDLIPLGAVPEIPWLPVRPTKATVYDWHRHGMRGIYLETIRCAGRLYTSESAVLIFLRRCAAPNPRPDAPAELMLQFAHR